MQNREMKANFRNGCLLVGVFLLLFLALLPRSAGAIFDDVGKFHFDRYEITPNIDRIDNSNWKVKLSNASCATPIQLNLSAFVGGDEISASVNMSSSMDFEIEFRNATLPDYFNSWSKSDWDPSGNKGAISPYSSYLIKDTYLDTSDLASLMSKIPYLGPLATVTFKKQIVGAATAPCIVRGKMTVSAIYKAEGLPNPGAGANYNTTIQITSIEPTNPNTTRLCAFVGDLETMQGGFGVIDASIGDIKLGKIGPIIAFNGGIFGGDIATWELEREAWTQTEMQHKSLGESVHSCAETGKPGCAEGTDHVIQETWYDWRAQIHLEIAGYTIWHNHSVLGASRDRLLKTTRRFHQSLTFNEPVIYTECPHKYYLLPVGVWANRSKTIPLRQMTVQPSEPVKEDENVIGISRDVTNEYGYAKVYVPYKSGKYTLTATGSGMTGSAEMPQDMVRGENEETDIFPTSSETRTLTARKEWDIDYEDKDRPEGVNVLLQAIYYSTASTAGGNIIEAFSTWDPVQILTLNEANNWEASFDPVPRRDTSGREIHYRIRELPALLENAESMNEKERLEWANSNVIHAPMDLDTDAVMEAVVEAGEETILTSEQMWQASLDPETFVKELVGNLFVQKKTVEFDVPAYTSSVGEYVDEHKTKYAVDYAVEDDTTVITNIAMLDIHAMKHWLGFSNKDDRPDSVWLVLLSRVKDEYLSLAGEMGDHMPYTPVFNPLTGASVSLGDLLGKLIPFGNLIAKLDPTGILTTSLAAGEAKESDHWLLSFGVKKYSMLKLPLDFECGEVTSEIIKALIKTLTGIDFPISISLTDGYITVPGKVFFIFGDTRGMSNILNIRLSPGDDEDDVAIGGTIWWRNEPENQKQNRPESVTIVVKDGDTVIARVNVPSQDNGNDSWVWYLRNEDLPAGTKLEPGKTYTVSEEFPENYPHKNSYMVHVDGHDVINVWAPSRKAVIRKQFEAGVTQKDVQVRLLAPQGNQLGNTCTLNAQNGYMATVTDARLASLDLFSLRAEELTPSSHGFIPAYSAPSVSVDKAGAVTFTYTITNRVQKNITVQIEKKWVGSGQRPASVKLLLKRNGTVIARPVLTAGGNWKASVSRDQNGRNLQLLDDQGRRYLYTLEEDSDGSGLGHYRFSVDTAQDQSGNITFTATNTWMETVTLQGTKQWVDSNNSERARPASINLSIMGNGVIRDNLTVTAPSRGGNRWSFSAGPLPRYDSDGTEISYSLLEEPVAAYVASYTNPDFDQTTGVWTCNVTNTLESSSRNITVTKVWVDPEVSPVRQQLRPASVKVMLYGQTAGSDKKQLMNTVVLSKENGWTHTFSGLRKYDKPGVEINYTVEEEPVPGYVCAVTGSMEAGYTLTNTFTSPEDSNIVRFTKTWYDDNNLKEIRPDSVTIRIMRRNSYTDPWTEYQTVVLSTENDWSALVTDLPLYIPNSFDGFNRAYYLYDFIEDPVPGYRTSQRGGAEMRDENFYHIDFANTATSQTITTRDIRVNKIWNDSNNAQQARPAEITLSLMDRDHMVRRVVLSADAAASGYTFTKVPKYRVNGQGEETGEEINYTVREEPIECYTSAVTGSMANGFTVTNTFGETGRIVVTKSWDDGNWNTPISMERPTEVTVVLKKGLSDIETVTLSEGNGWTHVFNGLKPNELDQYTVEERNVPAHYTVSYSRGGKTVSKGVHTLPITVTNTRAVPQKAKYTISKTWRLPDGTNPGWSENETVTFFLLANGVIVNQTVLSADHQTHTFTDLRALEGENWIDYEIVEQSADGYISMAGKKGARTEADGTVLYTQSFTNSYNPTFNIRVTKQWKHYQNPTHPKSVRITVLDASNNDQRVEGGEATLSEENNWTHTFRLPAYNKRNILAHYTVGEDAGNPRYKAAWNPPQAYGRGQGISYHDAKDGEYALTVTNSYLPENNDYTVTINWDDFEYPELREFRPDSVKVYLTINGQKTNKFINVTGGKTDRSWSGTFSWTELELDPNVYYDGVVEDSIPGYTVVSSGLTGPYAFQITNRAQAVLYRLEKKWQNAQGKPESPLPDKKVRFTLHHGKTGEILAERTLEKDNKYGKEVIVPLLLDENGDEILHYIREYFVYDSSDIYNYVVTYSQPEPYDFYLDKYIKKAYRLTVTNRTPSEFRDFIIRKEWRLRKGESSSGRSWTYNLYADGILYGEGGGVYNNTEVVRRLPATRDGVPIVYTVKEKDIPEGFLVSYEDITDAQAQIIGCKIINTQINYQLPVKGVKTWNDNNNALGLRPDSITIRLLQDGKEIARKAVSSADGWSWDFGLVDPIYTDSDYKTAIHTYSITEDPVPFYDAVIDGFNVTNTLQTVSYTVTKQWLEAAGYTHPDHIKVSVLDENKNEVASAELKASENWTHTFTNLPRYGRDGYEIWYTFQEEKIPGYTSYYLQDEYRNITLINVPSVSIQVRKVWQTGGEHPNQLVVYLYANGELQDHLVLDAGTQWTGTFADLPILDRQNPPQPINYTVREEALSGFYCTENVASEHAWQKQITLTNTPYDPVQVSIPVRKTVACNPTHLTAPAETFTLTLMPILEIDEQGNPIFDTGNQKELKISTTGAGSYDSAFQETFTTTGLHLFQLQESDSNDPGYICDTDPRMLMINVYQKENAPGTLEARIYLLQGKIQENSETTRIPVDAEHPVSFTNTFKGRIEITKVWHDNNDGDHRRPASVTVSIRKKGSESPQGSFQLTSENNWKIALDVEEYPVYDTSTTPATPIEYELTEAIPNGYSGNISGSAQEGFTVTNTRATMNLFVEKRWQHGDNPVGQQPQAVTVRLKKGNENLRDVTLNAANNWAYMFEKLDFLQDGTEYKVEEVDIPDGYTRTITRNGNGKTELTNFLITNIYVHQTRDVPVTKVWKDEGDTSRRPESVTVRIRAERDSAIWEEETLGEWNNWSHTFENLRVYYDQAEKERITYLVEEINPPKWYTFSVNKDQGNGFTITNTLKERITITKVWNDNANAAGLRPESVRVHLTKGNGETYNKSFDITGEAAANQWTLILDPDDYPVRDAGGELIEYHLTEDSVAQYSSTIEGNAKDGFVVTNTLKDRISVKKRWIDGGYEKRPTSVTVYIQKEGESAPKPIILKASEGWTVTLNADEYPASGTYTLTEEPINGYDWSCERKENTFTLTNIRATIRIFVRKEWQHRTNPEGKRPQAVTVQLKKGDEPLQEVILNASNNHQYMFENLDFLRDGTVYNVEEVDIPDGYRRTITQKGDGKTEFTSFTVTNTLKDRITITKIWNDAGNAAGLRPTSVKVNLKRKGNDDTYDEKTFRITGKAGENQWTLILDPDEYPVRDESGNLIEYQLTEEPVDQYRTTSEGSAEDGFVVINTLKDRISVTKRWIDGDYEKRPTSVTVYIQKEGESAPEPIILEASKGWTVTLDADEYPVSGTYTLTEEPVNGYTCSCERKDNIFILTNIRATMNVSVHKEWFHGTNPEEQWPQAVTVRLKKGNETLQDVILNKDNRWAYTFNDLDFLRDGTEYSVEEVNVPEGYKRTIVREGDGKAEQTNFTITNTYVHQTRDIPVTKVWEKDDEDKSRRPESVTVRIRAEKQSDLWEEATLGEWNNWSHTFENMPFHYEQSEQEAIKYIVEEINLPKWYKSSVSEDQGNGFTITNTLKEWMTITKVWFDDLNADGHRPESVRVHLKKRNDDTYDKPFVLTGEATEKQWTLILDPDEYPVRDASGELIDYILTEEPVNGYTCSCVRKENTFTLTNFRATMNLFVKKYWQHGTNPQDQWPETAVFRLKKGNETLRYVILNEANNWQYMFDNLDYLQDGTEYRVEEMDIPDGYTRKISREGDGKRGYTSFAVTNVYVHKTRDIPVIKVWEDKDASWRPESVTVRIRAEMQSDLWEEEALGEWNNWSHTFENLPFHYEQSEQEAIKYIVEEIDPPKWYKSSVSEDQGNGFTITNTLKEWMTITKVWNDNANADGRRPASVTVHLKKRNDETYDKPFVITGEATASQWNFIFDPDDFPVRDENGELIDYMLTEEPVNGYTCSCVRKENTFILTNTRATMNLFVEKRWQHGTNPVEQQPQTVTIRLKKGNETLRDVTLNAANDWQYMFENLDTLQDGSEYKVEEVNIPDGYTRRIRREGDGKAGDTSFIITNSYVHQTRDVPVTKVWEDEDVIFRPESVTVRIRAEKQSDLWEEVTLGEWNNWHHTFENMPVYYDLTEQEAITYIVEEINPPKGYTSSMNRDQGQEFTITNTLRTINIRVNKIWDDDNNVLGDRPETLQVTLRGNGADVASASLTPDSSGIWTCLFENLPQYEDHGDGTATEIEYNLLETDTPGYITNAPADYTFDSETKTGTFTLTNTRVTMDIPVTKYWLDERKTHPATTFILYSNREEEETDLEVARLTLTEADAVSSGAGSPWKGKFTNLPVVTTDEGRVIRYTLKEVPLEGYEEPVIMEDGEQKPDGSASIFNGFNVFNIPESATAAVYAVKHWEDEDNALGIRPKQVMTHLWNGNTKISDIPLTGENGSYGKVEDLLLTDEEGREITYTLTEEEVPAYESTITLEKVELPDRKVYVFFVQNTLREDACVLTYDPNGGMLEGSTEPLLEGHRLGTTIKIHEAPVRGGYLFQYWKGSEYLPGDEYTVTGDHTFVAQWQRADPWNFRFSFTKRWSGQPLDSIDWTLYDGEGKAIRKMFNKEIVSDYEWQYWGWLPASGDYYVIEKPVPGYETIYENVGEYAGVTDRCYNGGTIVNYKVPPTGDDSRLPLWIALGTAGIVLMIVLMRRRK